MTAPTAYRLPGTGQRIYQTDDGRWRDLNTGLPLREAPSPELIAVSTPLHLAVTLPGQAAR